MNLNAFLILLSPLGLMLLSGAYAKLSRADHVIKWKTLMATSILSPFLMLIGVILSLSNSAAVDVTLLQGSLASSNLYVATSLLVQILGIVIGMFSYRYLDGEKRQAYFVTNFSLVLASVHFMLIANHWILMIIAWAAVSRFMRNLLCFYADRAFALMASHKKQIADGVADFLLILAAGLAWVEVGNWSISGLSDYLNVSSPTILLHISAIFLVLAIVIRTALLPVHGWLIQVMEAPTPVSALLHAGVINLSGFIVIRFSALLEASPVARWVLIVFGLATALLAAMSMMTRASVKVRLAWSTAAQMGFMLLECGLGLYTFAAIHLIGHSIYKAHAFLSASSVVENDRVNQMQGKNNPSLTSFMVAPLLALIMVFAVQYLLGHINSWPWWWSAVLALAWAPLLWVSISVRRHLVTSIGRGLIGVAYAALLTSILILSHYIPLGIDDAPLSNAGYFVLIGMACFYFFLAAIKFTPNRVDVLRRWAYAGFYLDEIYTKVTLKIWPTLIKKS